MHELEILLNRLKMEHLSYHVESLLEQAAKKELNYREFLCMALQQEWNGRHQRGMESRLKQARLPWVKTLEQFDFTFQPGIDRKVVRELAGLAFVERSENVILLGPPGVGKTHLAIALGVKAVDAGHRVLFMPLDRLIATLMKAKQEKRLERQLQQLSYARVLILDEIGYLPMNREEASLFFRLLNRRYESEHHTDVKQRVRRLGRNDRRSRAGNIDTGSAATSLNHAEYQRRELPVKRET